MNSTTEGIIQTSRGQLAREAILLAAERLFAEHGLDNVSHRQISAAAGQGNTAAVNYHFGTTEDLVQAIVHRHAMELEHLRVRMVAGIAGSTELRDWIGCLVRPVARHLEALGSPTWYARLGAQVATDPRYLGTLAEMTAASPSLQLVLRGLERCLPTLPAPVRAERKEMSRLLIVHVLAERETALALGLPTPRLTWNDCASGVVDALVGLWLAPVSTDGTDSRATSVVSPADRS